MSPLLVHDTLPSREIWTVTGLSVSIYLSVSFCVLFNNTSCLGRLTEHQRWNEPTGWAADETVMWSPTSSSYLLRAGGIAINKEITADQVVKLDINMEYVSITGRDQPERLRCIELLSRECNIKISDFDFLYASHSKNRSCHCTTPSVNKISTGLSNRHHPMPFPVTSATWEPRGTYSENRDELCLLEIKNALLYKINHLEQVRESHVV